MAILDLEVEDINLLIEFKKAYAVNGCGVPVLGVDNITGIQITRINPTFIFYLERVSFSTLNNLAVNVKLNQSVYLVDSGCYNPLFRCFTGYVVNAGNSIANLNSLNRLFAESGAGTNTLYNI